MAQSSGEDMVSPCGPHSHSQVKNITYFPYDFKVMDVGCATNITLILFRKIENFSSPFTQFNNHHKYRF